MLHKLIVVPATTAALFFGALVAAPAASAAGGPPVSDPLPMSNVYMNLSHTSYDETTYAPVGPLVSATQAWTVDNDLPVNCDVSVCGGIKIYKVNGVRKAYLSLVQNEQLQFASFGYSAADGAAISSSNWDGRGLKLRIWRYNAYGELELFKLNYVFASVYNSDYPQPHYPSSDPCVSPECGSIVA